MRVSAAVTKVTLPAKIVMAHPCVVFVVAKNVVIIFPLSLSLNYGDFAGMSVGAINAARALVA